MIYIYHKGTPSDPQQEITQANNPNYSTLTSLYSCKIILCLFFLFVIPFSKVIILKGSDDKTITRFTTTTTTTYNDNCLKQTWAAWGHPTHPPRPNRHLFGDGEGPNSPIREYPLTSHPQERPRMKSPICLVTRKSAM